MPFYLCNRKTPLSLNKARDEYNYKKRKGIIPWHHSFYEILHSQITRSTNHTYEDRFMIKSYMFWNKDDFYCPNDPVWLAWLRDGIDSDISVINVNEGYELFFMDVDEYEALPDSGFGGKILK